ncbi:hypothetical protein F5Y17DRAFT_430448 [Xylariaceae sp. FL0594]|nr:hypothetical protein F5Y17DRAFT_430448 [Xylariaceae sp. FL0594]
MYLLGHVVGCYVEAVLFFVMFGRVKCQCHVAGGESNRPSGRKSTPMAFYELASRPSCNSEFRNILRSKFLLDSDQTGYSTGQGLLGPHASSRGSR